MSTSNLFVELIIIGIGFTLSFLFGLYCMDVVKLELLTSVKMDGLIILPILISVVYSLGIVADRIADGLFTWQGNKIREKYYPDRNKVLEDKSIILLEDSPLAEMILYGRSRMRICRGWMLNLVMLLPSMNYFFIKLNPQPDAFLVLVNFMLMLLIVLFYFSWIKLTDSEYDKLKELSKIRRKKK